jgi:hypothetical protein
MLASSSSMQGESDFLPAGNPYRFYLVRFCSSLAIGILAGDNETKRRLVIETIRLAKIFNEDDWRLISTWLDGGLDDMSDER